MMTYEITTISLVCSTKLVVSGELASQWSTYRFDDRVYEFFTSSQRESYALQQFEILQQIDVRLHVNVKIALVIDRRLQQCSQFVNYVSLLVTRRCWSSVYLASPSPCSPGGAVGVSVGVDDGVILSVP
jgi:hypothetical protein